MRSCRILIVEDDEDIRETLTEVCLTEGHEVSGARHGREALDFLQSAPPGPCMVLLDLMMPVMDGKTFLETVSVELPDRVKDLSIVVFSAGASISHPLVKGFLKKPVDLDEVLSMVNSSCAAP